MADFWDRHDYTSRAAMMTRLAPLVAASRTKTFTADESRAYMISLADVSPVLLEETVEGLLTRGITWMPKPGELKAECAKVMDRKRTAAMALHLEDCPHGSARMVENAHGRMEKCGCWRRAVEAANQIGRAIALPELGVYPTAIHYDDGKGQ